MTDYIALYGDKEYGQPQSEYILLDCKIEDGQLLYKYFIHIDDEHEPSLVRSASGYIHSGAHTFIKIQ